MKAALLIAAFLSAISAAAQEAPKPQPPPGPSPEERRVLEEEQRRRDAEDAARLERTLDRLENLHRLPLSPEEIEARRRRRLPQFLKDLEAFKAASQQIISYGAQPSPKAVKEMRSKAKTLERLVNDLMDYVTDGEDPPDAPEENYESMPLPERLGLLTSMAPSLHKRLKETYKAPLIDVNTQIELIEDLQSAKLLSHSLRK